MNSLYNHVLHYNHLTELWSAIPRDKLNEYWSNYETEGVLRAKDFMVLIELINKGNTFVESIEQSNP
jgi:hypothetical protein